MLKRNNIKYLEKWEILSNFAYISAVWLLKAKYNAKLFSMMMSIEFWPNCNQTADKKANLKNISHFSKYLILFLLGLYYLADKGNYLYSLTSQKEIDYFLRVFLIFFHEQHFPLKYATLANIHKIFSRFLDKRTLWTRNVELLQTYIEVWPQIIPNSSFGFNSFNHTSFYYTRSKLY